MNSKMILILVIAVFFSGVLVPAFADTTGACGIEKKDIIKSILGYITHKSDINRGQVMVLIKAYLGNVHCGTVDNPNTELDEARDKADDIIDDILPKCSDGTLFAHCSDDKPKYCYSGKLVDRCDLCCDSGRCTPDGKCEDELNLIDCVQAYGSGFFCGTYSDWEGPCQSVGQINKLTDQKCSDSIDATQYCIKCECVTSCLTSPGCRDDLTDGHIVGGECCGAGSCYDCDDGYIWDGIMNSCVISGPPIFGDYYVSPSGSDLNPGTFEKPFKTIQKAADVVVAGDTVIVRDGVYSNPLEYDYGCVARFTTAGTSDNWITFKSENTYGAKIDGQSSQTATGFQVYGNSAYLRFEGFEFSDFSWFGISTGFTESSNNIYIYNCKIHDIGRITYGGSGGFAGIYTGPKTSYFTVDRCIFYDIGRNHDSFPSGSTYYHNFVHDHGWYSQGHHHTIKNSIFRNMLSGWAVKIDGYNGAALTGDGWTHKLIGNTFANDGNPSTTSGVGLITFYKNPSIDNKYRNVVIANNVFYDATGDEAIEVGPSGKLCGTYSSGIWPPDGFIKINNNVANDLYLIQECLEADVIEFNNNIDASTVSGIHNTDLGMVNPENNEFMLTPSATYLIDKGIFTDALTYDYVGTSRPQSSAPDIGAYEYGSGSGSVYYVPISTSTVDGDTFCDGKCTSSDTIIIRRGARGSLLFQDFNGAGSYITITNENKNPDSKVEITSNGGAGTGILSLSNCKYVDLRGDNDADLTYGIKVRDDGTPVRSGAVKVYGESDHIKLSYLEIDHIGSTSITGIGIQVGDAIGLTSAWIFNNFEIHHNYIHDTRYAGMYLGHNNPGSENDPYVGTFSIHDNLLENMGAYGITFKGVKGSDNYIYNNIVRNTGLVRDDLTDNFKQGIGVQMFKSGYMVEIYNNQIEHTIGPGIKIGSGAGNLIYDNKILGCGTGNEVKWGHGILVHAPTAHSNKIYDNIVIQAKRYGIYGCWETHDNTHKRNLIGDCGIGEAGGIGLIEGTGADANIYHTDVADFNFNVWSDDGEYSNDDFTFGGTNTTNPIVTLFNINPTTANTNSPITASYTVTDETALKQVELWRTTDSGGFPNSGSWAKIKANIVSGTSASGSFTDSLSSAGTYWYGIHVVDQAGNIGYEPSPVRVVVNSGSSCANEIWVATPVTAATINSAIASARPGDCVIIPDGTYARLGQIKIPSAVDGTDANPITLKAATAGGVTFTGNSASPLIFVQGDWWVIRDFKFIDFSEVGDANTKGIAIRDASNVRITNNYFQRFGDLVNAGKQNWPILIADAGTGDSARVDHNTFIDNEAMCISVSSKGINTQIDHNYFKNTFDDNSNAMMIGTGGSPANDATDLYTIVEYNIFENMYGDESVSNKASSNTYRYNVFKESGGQSNRGLVLRGGDDCIVDGNYFFDVDKQNIRVHGTGHKIINNYFENPGYSAILLAEGGTNYANVADILIADNTIVNPVLRGIHIGWWSGGDVKPNNLIFKNNIIQSSTGTLVRDEGHTGTFIWQNNLHYATGGASYWQNGGGGNEPSGITHANPNLIQGTYIQRLQSASVNVIGKGTPIASITDDIDGHLRDGTNPDIGCDEYSGSAPARLPVTENEVGVSWLRTTQTCQSQGHRCCSSCESGAHPEFDADCPSQVCCAVCTTITEPVLHLKFEEGSGTTATDSSGNNNDGIINGAVYTAGKIGDYALEFDGVGDYVNAGNNFNLGTDDWTIGFWINQNSAADFKSVISKGTYNGAGDILVYDINNNDARGYMSFRNDDNTGNEIINIGDSSLAGTGWRHITVTRSGTTINTYLDGKFSRTGTIESNYDFTNAHNWIIGAREDGTSAFIDAAIDEMIIYRQALNSAEVLALYSISDSDTTPPQATSFTINPTTANTNSPITASYTVTDNTALNRVELWRTTDSGGVPNSGNWAKINSETVSGTSDSGSLTDSISSAGTYWYKIRVVDEAGNIGYEPSPVKVTVNSDAYLSIIPGLRGFGTETRAAYGAANDPIIFIVTDLTTDNGAPGNSIRNGVAVKTGSFLEAVNYAPPANTGKIILFEVSGTINAVSAPYMYYIKYPYTTIAGHTAPSPGITLRNIVLATETHDILVQHIKSRVGDAVNGERPDTRRPLQMTAWRNTDVFNVVYDHLSGSWSIDTMGLFWEQGGYQTYDCTWSNSIFSEALHDSLHSKGPHSKGPVINAYTNNISFIKNFLVNNDARNPYLRRSTSVLVNNYIYNPGYASIQLEIISGSVTSSIVGNLIEGGPSSSTYAYQNHFSCKAITTASEIYLNNNKCGKASVGWYTQTSANDWSHVRWWGGQADVSNQIKELTPPIWPDGLVAMDVDDVKSYVLANVGARPADRDSADQRVVDHAKSGGTQGKIIDSPSDVGGWPVLAENKITLAIPANPHGDDDNDGYTNLEEWLHGLAADVEGR